LIHFTVQSWQIIFTTLKLGPKKQPPVFTLPDELLIKTYVKPKRKDDDPDTPEEEIVYYSSKFLGDYANNNLQTLIIDTDTNQPIQYDDDTDINFHNIKNAIPKSSKVSIYVDLLRGIYHF